MNVSQKLELRHQGALNIRKFDTGGDRSDERQNARVSAAQTVSSKRQLIAQSTESRLADD
jgi:hypothetical protein